MSEPKPDLIAQLDQAGKELEARATLQGTYFVKLLDEGFYRDEAFELVRDQFPGVMVEEVEDE